MSGDIGPSLPPGFREAKPSDSEDSDSDSHSSQSNQSSSDSDIDNSVSPRARIGPIGPAMPPGFQAAAQSESNVRDDMETDSFGPALPPGLAPKVLKPIYFDMFTIAKNRIILNRVMTFSPPRLSGNQLNVNQRNYAYMGG